MKRKGVIAFNHPVLQVLASLPLGTEADVDAAVVAAKRAFNYDPWSVMSGRDRGAILLKVSHLFLGRLHSNINNNDPGTKLADVLKENEEELALLETLDGGFPIAQSKNLHLADAIAVRA